VKLAVTSRGPDLASEIDPRFVQAKFFVVVDTDTGRYTTHEKDQNRETAGRAAQKVMDLGVDAVITGNVSDEALATLEAGNVEVCTGGSGGSVGDAVERLKAEQLKNASKVHEEKYYWT